MREVVDAVAARAAERWGERRRRPGRRRVAARADDLAPFSRGDGPGEHRSAPARATARSVRLGPAGRGRRRPRASTIDEPQARVDAGQGRASAPTYRRLRAHDARPRPRHRVRGGRLPEHLRVLGRRHRHVHDQRRALHPGLRLLPGRHPPPRGRSTRPSPSGWPRPSSAWACASPWSPPSPATTSPTAGPPRSPPRSGPSGAARPGVPGRGADPRLQGRPRRARRRSSTPAPTCSTTTSRPWPGCSGPCGRRPATPARLVGAGPGQGRRAHHQVGRSSSAWARPTTRSSQALADLARRRRRHRHHRPVPAADHAPPAGGPLGGRPDEFDRAARPPARPWASATSRPARSTRSQLPRPPGRRGPRDRDPRHGPRQPLAAEPQVRSEAVGGGGPAVGAHQPDQQRSPGAGRRRR